MFQKNCYKLTIATTEENKNQVFRFVGNHKQAINWFENGTKATDKAATYPYSETNPVGHKASPSDPNEVSITENGLTESTDDNLNIIWNRPAGTWTVRFHIYTYLNGDNPSFRYFYTISENRDLELRDFGDVVYGEETRNILKKVIIDISEHGVIIRLGSVLRMWMSLLYQKLLQIKLVMEVLN